MKNNGKSETTIISVSRTLNQLARISDLTNPEQTKNIISSQKWNNATKQKTADIYTAYLRFQNLTWTKPHYKIQQRIPFIPTETEIDQLIASSGQRMATLIQTMKETGARISETIRLKWTDLDTEHRTLNITPSKNSNPRLIQISSKLLNMINEMPHNRETIFSTCIKGLRTQYSTARRFASQKLQNPRLLQITFHTLRHYYATMLYHRTKDIVHVQQQLGHKDIQNTMIYINIEQALFLDQDDQWICKVAHNEQEIIQLIEAGFDKVTDYNGNVIFRKRK
jgi:integrase